MKYAMITYGLYMDASLPSRERGLKLYRLFLTTISKLSLPSRERGLKYASEHGFHGLVYVAPLAGAWIEIVFIKPYRYWMTVSLPSRERGLKYAVKPNGRYPKASLPSRERGLKSVILHIPFGSSFVAPLAGAWIEIDLNYVDQDKQQSRSPRGSVD